MESQQGKAYRSVNRDRKAKMFERALSLRRKLLRALKMHLGVGKSSSLPRKPDAVIHKSKLDMDVLRLEAAADGVPQIMCTAVQSDSEVISRSQASTAIRTAPEIDAAVPLRLVSKTPLTIVVPPRAPVPVPAQSPLRTPESSEGRAGPSPRDLSRVERFQRMQQQLQRRAITRARSMPLSVSDPMRKLRDSYVRIMHKMTQDEAKANPLSPSSALVVVNEHSRVFDYLHRRRSPAADEEEEFCRLAVMRTKISRSQSLF